MRSLLFRRPLVPAAAVLALTSLLGGCEDHGPQPPGWEQGGYGGADPDLPCAAPDTCNYDLECLAATSNVGRAEPGFRIAQLSIATPATLRDGLWAMLGGDVFGPAIPACGLSNAGTTSWLLQLDPVLGQVRTGIAAPSDGTDAPQSYAFYDATITLAGQPRHIAPLTLDVTADAQGRLQTVTPGDLDVQLFWPAAYGGAPEGDPTVFPLHGVTLRDVEISASQNCVGSYTPGNVTIGDGCGYGEVFSPGGSIDAFISLEEADGLTVNIVNQSLCALLAGAAPAWDGAGQPATRCARTNGVIDFAGDWCAATNAPADASCHDALRFHADFAASAAVITP
jgi:hypothetical protein